MPRANYGEKRTVSLLRGSNLDKAATDAVIRAEAQALSDGDEEDEEEEEDDRLYRQEERTEEGPIASTPHRRLHPALITEPVHVFDPDAREHVCLDLPSPVVDVLAIGGCPAASRTQLGDSDSCMGPVQALLILCEEELVAVDLVSSGWPYFRPPYLTTLHASTLTTHCLVTQVGSCNSF
ncbi:unnamed protein product [Protopolystoma xenopodis]|uniref:Lethal giant larvae homologue 2 domain-containing protein n=1 Tax=Protopolystoma xenopodis TaxID=117903 RepID=A0A448WKK9_9PLAT|nr:unnamed protein product [Protopolystoma xenopodis]